MRISEKSGSAVSLGAGHLGETDASDTRPPPDVSVSAKPLRPPVDVATVMGVPEAELTPKVRVAMDRLMAEVHTLRDELNRVRRRVEYLEQEADRDPLVPVLNRRAFVRELTRMIAFAERYGVPGSVLYFDINGMKAINDSLGHAAGDSALKHVAQVLLADIRASDIVGRLGGDEFGVILAQADAAAAASKAAALAKAIAGTPADLRGQPVELSVSYGVYSFKGSEDVDQALVAADEAMYSQKRQRISAAE